MNYTVLNLCINLLSAVTTLDSNDTYELFNMKLSRLHFFSSAFCYSNGDKVLLNRQDGYLMRTKRVGVNEGGLLNGSAFLDNPYLVDL
jgi:hypothetical protein